MLAQTDTQQSSSHFVAETPPNNQEINVENVAVQKKPLDFLLPFAVAANAGGGFLSSENLLMLVAPLAEHRFAANDDENLYLLDFFISQGRLPFVSDNPKPWHYQGWLLPYLILANAAHPQVVNRWGWWAACHLRGGLIEEAIPHVHFNSEFNQTTKDSFKMVDRCLEIIRHTGGNSWSSFTDFIEWLAWGCGVGNVPSNLSEKANEALYRAFSIEPFALFPSDHFGQYLSEQRGSGMNPNAFYPTPHAVCELMTQINFADDSGDDAIDSRMMTVCDPAVGSGRLLLHASNRSVRLYGTDIDSLVVKICLINGAFYAPWLSFPFPETWFAEFDARNRKKPEEKFALGAEYDNRLMANKILQKLKINFPARTDLNLPVHSD